MHDIIIAVIGCGVLNIIATAIINAHNNKKDRLKSVEEKVDQVNNRLNDVEDKLTISERDALRTQLLLMISDYPTNIEGIMTLGQRYFGELHGNWYATAIFQRWLHDYGIAIPEWFKEEE